MSALENLKPQYQDFVLALFANNFNATEAARQAGYAESTARLTGHRLITNDNIKAAIAELQESNEEKHDITEGYVIDRLKMEAELYGEGSSHSARVKAVELLGKHIGMFQDQPKENDPIDLSHLPDADLIEIHEKIQSVTIHRRSKD